MVKKLVQILMVLYHHIGSVDKCKYSDQECKAKLLHSELKGAVGESGAATSIKKIIEDKQLQLKKSGMTASDIANIMPQYYSIKSAMYRSKSLNYPKIPDNLESLNFFTDACKIFRETVTSKVDDVIIPGERFLLFDGWSEIKDARAGRTHLVTARERVTIFCSDAGLRLLSQAEKNIMAWMKGNKGSFCLPAAFVLLGGKHKQTYILMLKELKKVIFLQET